MARYSVDINANIKGFEELDNIEKQIKNIQNYAKKPIDINFRVDAKNADISKQMMIAGKSAASAFAKGFSSIDSMSIDNFAKTKQKYLDIFNDIQKQLAKTTGSSFEKVSIDEKQINKWANEYVNTQQKAFEKIEKEAIKQQQNLNKIREKEAASYANPYKDAYQSIGDKSDIQKQMSEYYTNLEKEAIKQQQQITKIKKEAESGLFEYRTVKNQSFLDKYTDQDSEALNHARKQIETINKLQSALKSGNLSNDDIVSTYSKLSDELDKLSYSMKQVGVESSKTLDPGVANAGANKVKAYYEQNTKAVKKYGDQLKEIEEQYRRAKTEEDKLVAERNFNQLKSQISAEGLTGKSYIDEFKRAFGQIAEFAGIYGAIQNVIYELPRQMVHNVLEVDDAMTNLQMATGVTNDKAKELMSTYNQLGDDLKALGTDVAASATEWMKQGKSIQESQKLAKDSIVLSKIGDLSAEESTKTITAAMKSYDLDESEVMGFIDKISAIDMASATDVGGLADAFNKVAANARNAGIETEKVLAYAATIGETTQEGMDSVGTSLNSIFSRMGNIKLSRLKDPTTNEDLSNVETSLRNVGIELRESTGQFRDFDEVLDETASRWSTFSEVTQRSIASSFAGTHHMNEFLVLMQNYSKAQEYMQIATDSSGESLKKYEAYTESAQGKIEGFKNSFQTLSTTTLNADIFKGVVDGGTAFLNILTKIMDVGGGLPTITASIAGIMSAKGKGKQNNNCRSLNALSYKIA